MDCLVIAGYNTSKNCTAIEISGLVNYMPLLNSLFYIEIISTSRGHKQLLLACQFPELGFWVTNFQFTAHTSKKGRQDKFMPFSGLVAITILLLFICYSLRHVRLFKLKFSYCFSKHRRYWDIFMVWRFRVKEIGETQALPLAFLCIFMMCSPKAAHICSVQPLENWRRCHCVMKAMAPFQWRTFSLDLNLSSDISAG